MASSSSTQELMERNQDQQQEQPQQQWQQQQQPLKECMHKTKTVQFLGRTTPIILQNDNGPCPLLAICNVLLLRNNLNLSPDIAEVSQEKLLSLVAERLIDSNSNVNNKDAGYVQNQQQNISDAIDLLPRLATGIDVNLKFRRIDDFEFTPECAIFDLLDIPLYHGWIVDSQDYDTANAIGSKSYNALMGELVTLETQNMEGQYKNTPEEDCIDFVAATTATLGVPSPNLSKPRSFDNSPHSVSDNQILRKGDPEQEAELLRVLKLPEAGDPVVGHINGETMSVIMDENKSNKEVILVGSGDKLEDNTVVGNNDSHEPEPSLPDNCIDSGKNSIARTSSDSTLGEAAKLSLKTDAINDLDQSSCMGPEKPFDQNDEVEKNYLDTLVQNERSSLHSPEKDSVSLHGSHGHVLGEDKKVHDQCTLLSDHEALEEPHGCDAARLSCLSATDTNSDLSSSKIWEIDVSDALASSADGNEPIYEGEECVLGARTTTFENHEPVYEGEAVLAEKADKSMLADASLRAKSEITPQQGELIRNFFRNNASQLTFYGLFSLLDGLKERELCVFFRNNHFSTMFKFEGELYLLATDLGYLNQPDLVWEKLNEVNGDTLFMTGNFKEFIVESQDNNTWDEHNAMTSTADYLASIDSGGQAGLNINSDLQLAIALQQQEFEQQPPRHNSQQFSSGGSSRLVTGSRVARNRGRPSATLTSSSSSPKAEGKSKERCIIM